MMSAKAPLAQYVIALVVARIMALIECHKVGQIQKGKAMTNTNPNRKYFEFSFEQEYELARRLGDARFGAACKHEKIMRGRCVKCLRRVVTRKAGR